MKIAVFSDSHGSSKGMVKAVREYEPEQIIHLGDGNADLRALEREFPRIPICAVSGNCDRDCLESEYKVIKLGTLKAFITHGHRYNVRYDIRTLLFAADCNECQLAMYGHTHRAGFEQIEGIFVLNPGTAGVGSGKTWAKLEIGPEGEIKCEICDI